MVVSNSALYPAWVYDGVGGGAYVATLNNCTLTGNLAGLGGAANSSTLNNCTLADNSAILYGGGAYSCLLNNCIIYFNGLIGSFGYPTDGPNHYVCTLNYCCSTCEDGCGSVTTEPLFMDLAAGNLRLQSNSPCINAGKNTYAPIGTDLDGNPRIMGGTVDIGAYEFQTPTSVISYAWLQQYGLPTDGSADFADSDGDGMNNWQEWIAGTNPTNALSVLKMMMPSTGTSPITLSWESVSRITYYLERATNLGVRPIFSSVQSNIVGQAGATSYTDTNAISTGPFFYRIGVQ